MDPMFDRGVGGLEAKLGFNSIPVLGETDSPLLGLSDGGCGMDSMFGIIPIFRFRLRSSKRNQRILMSYHLNLNITEIKTQK